MADLRNDKKKIFLRDDYLDGALWGHGYDMGTPLFAKLKKKLSAHAFDIDFVGDKYGYYEPLCDNMIWELSCAHNDIAKIKHQLVERQIQSLLLSVHSGHIRIEDI